MDSENFNSIFLTKYEITLLDEIGGGIITKPYITEHLISLGFLANYNKQKDRFVITPKGVRYLEFIEQKKIKESEEKKLAGRRYWISLIITNLISLAALAVSIIALLNTPQ